MKEARKRPSIDGLVREFTTGFEGVEIDQAALDDLRRFIAKRRTGDPPSRMRLLDALLATDAPVSRAIGGFAPDLRGRVRIRDLDSAQSSLIDVAGEYETARQAGDRERASDCRRAVLHSKQRLEFLLRRPNLSDQKRTERRELREWFRVWLEAPGLFEQWVALRRRNPAN